MRNASCRAIQLIARKSFLIVLCRGINGILGYLSMLFIARFMGKEVYGSIGFAIAFIGTFLFIADFGFGQAHVKRISEGKDLGKCIGTYMTIKLVITALLVVVVLSVIGFWKFVMHKGFTDSVADERILYLFLLYFVFQSIASIAMHTFDARTETAKGQIPLVIEVVIRMPITIAVVLASLSLIHIALAYLLGMLGTMAMALLFLRNYPIKRTDWTFIKSYYQFALPSLGITIVGTVMGNIDKVLIGYFWKAGETGLYYSVQNITNTIYFVSPALCAILFPTVSGLHTKKDIKTIRNLTRNSERYLSMIVFPIVTFVFLFPESIIRILIAESFLPAANILRVMAIYTMLAVLNGPQWSQISAVNRIGTALKIAAASAILMVALYLFLIPGSGWFPVPTLGFGAFGASLGLLAGAIFSVAIVRVTVYRLTGTKTNWRIILHFIAASSMAVCLLGLSVLFNIVRWFDLLFFSLLGLGIYVLVLYAFDEFTSKELRKFLDILHPGRLGSYVKQEIRTRSKK